MQTSSLQILLLLQCFYCGDFTLLPPANIDIADEKHMADCIINIGRKFFRNDLPVGIETSYTWSTFLWKNFGQHFKTNQYGNVLLEELHKARNWSVLLFGYTRARKHVGVKIIKPPREKEAAVILILGSGEIEQQRLIMNYMFKRLRRESWNPRGFYVIASMSIPNSVRERRKWAKYLLGDIMKHSVHQAIVLIPRTKNALQMKTVDIYSWFPHEQQNICSKELTSISYRDTCISVAENETGFLHNTDLFLSNAVTDMKGCIVKMTPNYWIPYVRMKRNKETNKDGEISGLAIEIMDTVARATNFILDYYVSDDSFGDLISGEIDIYGPDIAYDFLLSVFDCSFVYSSDGLTWSVPLGSKIPRWKNLIRIFDSYLWILILIAFITGTFIFWLFEKFQNMTQSEKKEMKSSVIAVFLNTLRSYLGVGMIYNFKGLACVMFSVAWLFYCLQIYTAYQSMLISFLTKTDRFAPISDVSELQESGIEMCSQLIYMSKYLDGGTSRPTARNVSLCKNDTTIYSQMAYRGNLAILGLRSHMEFIGHSKYTYKGKPAFVQFKDNIISVKPIIVFHKGSRIFDRYESVVQRLRSGGLVDRMLKAIELKERKIFETIDLDGDVSVLLLSHLQGVFYLLFVGYLTAFSIFMIELFY